MADRVTDRADRVTERLLRSLAPGATVATDSDDIAPGDFVDLLDLITVPKTRKGIETAIAYWEPRVKRPGGLVVIHGWADPDPETAAYTDAINEWLRRRSEFWQAIELGSAQGPHHYIVVKARGRR